MSMPATERAEQGGSLWRWALLGVGLTCIVAVGIESIAEKTRPTMGQVFLAELKETAGCDPTTLVPFEQLEIRLTKTTDELIAICERFVPSRKLKFKDLERK